MSDIVGRSVIVTGNELLTYNLGPTHPLRPERLKVALALMKSYGLITSADLLPPRLAKPDELRLFHTEEYLKRVQEYSERGYGLLDEGDTPAFKGCFEATSWVAGASLAGIEAIMRGVADHAFNFSGGLHHAHPERASGFCIFNDPAICVAFLKKNFGIKRVAYIDIDAHQGDGVMYGFYSDPSVLDIDFHENGRYLFPGTGFPDEVGEGEAKGLKINIPLPPGTGDELYLKVFNMVVPSALERYKPEFILLQAGADSHRGDRLSHLSITVRTYNGAASTLHGLAHEYCGGRIIVFGGGGYNLGNVARCWASIFSTFIKTKLPAALPSDWREYYRTITGEEAPKVMLESEEAILDKAESQEMTRIINQLQRTTILGN